MHRPSNRLILCLILALCPLLFWLGEALIQHRFTHPDFDWSLVPDKSDPLTRVESKLARLVDRPVTVFARRPSSNVIAQWATPRRSQPVTVFVLPPNTKSGTTFCRLRGTLTAQPITPVKSMPYILTFKYDHFSPQPNFILEFLRPASLAGWIGWALMGVTAILLVPLATAARAYRLITAILFVLLSLSLTALFFASKPFILGLAFPSNVCQPTVSVRSGQLQFSCYITHPDYVRSSPLLTVRPNPSKTFANQFKILTSAQLYANDTFVVSLVIPLPYLILPTTLTAALFYKTRPRKTLPNHCPHCNYDLRATPTQCPECGYKPKQSAMGN